MDEFQYEGHTPTIPVDSVNVALPGKDRMITLRFESKHAIPVLTPHPDGGMAQVPCIPCQVTLTEDQIRELMMLVEKSLGYLEK